jgi:hypothetical protein
MAVSVGDQRRLSAQEAETLWRAWTLVGDTTSRDLLVTSYSPLVQIAATQKALELSAPAELGELLTCGLLALHEAVDRFAPSAGTTFEQHVWGAISDAIVEWILMHSDTDGPDGPGGADAFPIAALINRTRPTQIEAIAA